MKTKLDSQPRAERDPDRAGGDLVKRLLPEKLEDQASALASLQAYHRWPDTTSTQKLLLEAAERIRQLEGNQE